MENAACAVSAFSGKSDLSIYCVENYSVSYEVADTIYGFLNEETGRSLVRDACACSDSVSEVKVR